MNYTAELYPALTMEECAKRVSDAVLHGGFGSGTEVDRYTVETAEGPVCILLFDTYYMFTQSTLPLCAVLDTVTGRLRLHLSVKDDSEYHSIRTCPAKKLLQLVEKALEE